MTILSSTDSVTQEDFREDNIARAIIDSGIKIHRMYGPGLLESVYELCLVKDLTSKGIKVQNQHPIPLCFEGENVGTGFRLDLIVDDRVIVEIKAVDATLPIHKAQLLTYLRLSEKRLGLLMNFNTKLLKDGITRLTLR